MNNVFTWLSIYTTFQRVSNIQIIKEIVYALSVMLSLQTNVSVGAVISSAQEPHLASGGRIGQHRSKGIAGG